MPMLACCSIANRSLHRFAFYSTVSKQASAHTSVVNIGFVKKQGQYRKH